MKTWKAACILLTALAVFILLSMPFLGPLGFFFNFNSSGGTPLPASGMVPDAPQTASPEPSAESQTETEMRGVWVSSIINLDYPSKPGLSPDALRAEADSILDDVKRMGFNAVFLQVRPSCDAFYKSDIFPWSSYLTGSQGKAPDGGFDPLLYWVEQAHARGLALHAWINPFRVTRGTKDAPNQDIGSLALSNPARQHPDWVVKYSDGGLYLNPGIPEVRSLIVSGVRELVEKYDIDGIHYDDYFYPAPDFPDEATFEKYGAGYQNIGDWRRENINSLIKETYAAVKETKPAVRFGVSPSGIWANKKNNALGSDTTGSESYYQRFADTRKWVQSGWLDYICPQIYWEIGFPAADYGKLLKWWADTVNGTGVDLYIGHAAYKCGTGQAGSAWAGTDELKRQFQLNALYEQVKGSVCFRYAFFRDYKPLGDFITQWYSQDAPALNPGSPRLSVGRPEKDTSTTASQMYILGSSDPAQPLYLNGAEVEERTQTGYFGVLVQLSPGINTLTFSQGGQSVTRSVTRAQAVQPAAQPMSKAEIVPGSASPNVYDEYRMPGEKVTLKCTAPIGADVTVSLGGKSYKLSPAASESPGGGTYSTVFSCVYTIPANGGTGKVINLGTPAYTMKFGSVTQTVSSTGDVKCILPGAPYYAEVLPDTAFTYASNTTTGGPIGELVKGQRDYITAVCGGGTWVRLGGTGQWILLSDVKRTLEESAVQNKISGVSYARGDKWDKAVFRLSSPAATRIDYDGKTLTFILSGAVDAPPVVLPEGSPFISAQAQKNGNNAQYAFTLAKPGGLNGYYVSLSGNDITLNIKPVPKTDAGDKPLSGFTIVVDPGHGGTSSGALGPLGSALAEKDIVLADSIWLQNSLEKLGATVVLTRTSDTDVSLEDRLKITREVKPDLFLSIHNNALDDSADCSAVRGIGTYYKNTVSVGFAGFIQNYLAGRLSIPVRSVYQDNLYVCRPYWTPAVLIETSFIGNPADFEWLSSETEQKKLADAIADGICAYFSAQ